MEPVVLTAARGRVALRMTCLAMGRDLSVTLSGGDREHIGAVALGRPDSAPSLLALPGHREDGLARDIASELASRTGSVVCVACGIHVEGITREELADVLAMAGELTRSLALALEGEARPQ